MLENKDFISKIEKRAKNKGLLEDVEKELDFFKKHGQIDYLCIVNDLVQRIKKECVPGTMLRMAGACSTVAYVLGFHKNNPKEHRLFSSLFFNKDYFDGTEGPRFDFSVPRSKKDDVLRILNEIAPIDPQKSLSSTFFFGERGQFRIGIYESEFLDRLCSAIKLIKEDSVGEWCKKDFDDLKDRNILKYMFALDDKGYCMPNLNGCVMGIPSLIYEFMEACEVHSLHDFALLNCIHYGIFKDKGNVIRSLKQDGLEGTICCREQLLDILVNRYGIDEARAFDIMMNLFERHRLSEADELILQSHEVPDGIIDQLNNINYLHYLAFSMEEVTIGYHLAEIKSYLPADFEKLIPVPYKNAFVGPFFFVGGRIRAFKDQMTSFSGNLRFFDSFMSHFGFFETLGIDGDYGNYPRGRVLFDNFHKRFIVYLDKDLMNDPAEKTIMEEYNLEKYKTIFRRDAHYTHDNL